MMEFYKVKIADDNNEWRAILKKEEDIKYGIIQALNNGRKPDLKSAFKMVLIQRDSSIKKNNCPYDLDLIYWTDDLMLDAFKPNNSNGAYFIVSQKFKGILEFYKLPIHFYLPIDLKQSENGDSKRYFVLFIMGRLVNNIVYNKSKFILETKTRPRKMVQEIGHGIFESKEEFISKQSNYLRNERLVLSFDEIALSVDFDVLWGIPNVMTVNAKVKEEIEASNINGVRIDPISSPTYLMKSEYEN